MCTDMKACCCAAALAQHAELAGFQSLWKAEGVLVHSGSEYCLWCGGPLVAHDAAAGA